MKLALRTAPAALPDWRTNPKLDEPKRALDAANAAIADAQRQLDTDAATLVAIDADLSSVTDERQASKLEDLREKTVLSEAESKNRLERAQRAVERAHRLHAPLVVAAMRECSDELHRRYVAQVRKVAASLEIVKAEADALDVLTEHIRATLPEQVYESSSGVDSGMLRRDVAGIWNEPPILGVPGLLAKMIGRRGQTIDQFVERLRTWRLR